MELACSELDTNAEVGDSSGCSLNSELSHNGVRPIHQQVHLSLQRGYWPSYCMLLSAASSLPLCKEAMEYGVSCP